ncbi:MAG: pentapeptide repeat-containing protein [Spirochaetaceae bacterium]|nr:pentapeptide repeat-containing protein [Spirochaetaceae bacterium]
MDILAMEAIDGEEPNGLDFSLCDLSGKEFSRCSFTDCDFSECDLTGTTFEKCGFTSCNLSNPVIAKARFVDVVFDRSKLLGLNFHHCDQLVFDIAFLECAVRSCNFTDLKMKKARFTRSEFRDCDFQNTFLVEADFSEAVFDNTLFHNSDLQRASFYRAAGYSIDPGTNKLKKAVFSVPEVLSLLGPLGIVIKD